MIAILALIAVFVAAYYVGKTAKDTGRNVVLWSLLTLGVGLGFQLVIPFVVALIISVLLIVTGTPPDQLNSALGGWWAILIGFGGIAISFVGIAIIVMQVSKIPDDPIRETVLPPPPPPPSFG